MMSDTQVNSCDSLTNLHSQGNSVALRAQAAANVKVGECLESGGLLRHHAVDAKAGKTSRPLPAAACLPRPLTPCCQQGLSLGWQRSTPDRQEPSPLGEVPCSGAQDDPLGCWQRKTDRVVARTCGHDEQTNRPVKRRSPPAVHFSRPKFCRRVLPYCRAGFASSAR
jgi:hypothetical protein